MKALLILALIVTFTVLSLKLAVEIYDEYKDDMYEDRDEKKHDGRIKEDDVFDRLEERWERMVKSEPHLVTSNMSDA